MGDPVNLLIDEPHTVDRTTAEQRRRASLYVCANATSPADAALLLAVLGLRDDTGATHWRRRR